MKEKQIKPIAAAFGNRHLIEDANTSYKIVEINRNNMKLE